MSNEEKFNPQTEPFNILSQPAHPQGEPKTDRDIIIEFIRVNDGPGVTQEQIEEALEQPELKDIIKLMSEARASERAQTIAEGAKELPRYYSLIENGEIEFQQHNTVGEWVKYSDANAALAVKDQEIGLLTIDRDHEKRLRQSCEKALQERDSIQIPQCLQECRLNEKDLKHVYATYESSGALALGVENKVLQKFSLLLSQVKGLPEHHQVTAKALELFGDDETEINLERHKVYVEHVIKIRDQASLLLLQRDEAHKAALEHCAELLVATKEIGKEFAEWAPENNWIYDGELWGHYPANAADPTEEKTTSELFDLFLKEKEGKQS